MFNRVNSTDIGLCPKNITAFLQKIEEGNNMHALMMMKGDEVFYEAYWAPYNRSSVHRMYSQTKSLNGIAIGMLEHEGRIKLDTPLYTYFSDKIDSELPKELKEQTIRNTLMMCTATECPLWFTNADRDRVHLYFNSSKIVKPAGTLFSYDSAASQVLSSLVERLTGMTSLEYIKSKAFAGTDVFGSARMLKTPTGEAWGDSALLCRLEDMAALGRFVMKSLAADGGDLFSSEYIHDAVSDLVSTGDDMFYSHKSQGYGYQIWHTLYDGFAFFGMGNQLTVCIPCIDFVFSCTADDQGYGESRRVLLDALYKYIVEPLTALQKQSESGLSLLQGADPLAELADLRELDTLTASLRLRVARGNASSKLIPSISGNRYECEPNSMGISEFVLSFEGEELVFEYDTDRGHKTMRAGCRENLFDYFPEEGYSDQIGGETAPGHRYRCAFSYAFVSDNVLSLQCRVIDEYLGNLTILFGFNGDSVGIKMTKNAENFMEEYSGRAIGYKVDRKDC